MNQSGAKSSETFTVGVQLLCFCIILALAMPMLGPNIIGQQVKKEQGALYTWYGRYEASLIISRSVRWFDFLFVTRGIYGDAVHDLDAPNEFHHPDASGPIDPASEESKRFQKTVFSSLSNSDASRSVWTRWIVAFFGILFFSVLRISTFVASIDFLLPFCLAIISTGFASQRRKWNGFGGTDPTKYIVGVRMSTWMAALGVGAIFIPVALPPVTLAGIAIMVSCGVSLRISNSIKPA